MTNPIYGAVGVGNHNDAPAIQAAIDAMDTAGKGGVLYFPPQDGIASEVLLIRQLKSSSAPTT